MDTQLGSNSALLVVFERYLIGYTGRLTFNEDPA